MKPSGEELLKADRKSEEHVPVIECRNRVKADKPFTVWITLGKGSAHPNTTEHHIRSIELHFLPDGEKAPYQIGNFEFTAHGESSERPDENPLFIHEAGMSMKTGKSGKLLAQVDCNLHGLWQSSKSVKVVQPAPEPCIQPYPGRRSKQNDQPGNKERKMRTAIHGVAKSVTLAGLVAVAALILSGCCSDKHCKSCQCMDHKMAPESQKMPMK